jgi:DNA-binding winged helix-turn-helix (wHTH) protein
MGETESAIIGYQFGEFRLELSNRILLWKSSEVPINSRYFDVLVLLVKRAGMLTSKEEIFNEVWQDVIVSDSALTQAIKDLRKALNDDAVHPKFIKTAPKHGYTFVCPVTAITALEMAEAPRFAEPVMRRPYKFLDYFTEQDSAIFFGRENEINQVISKILIHRTFIIHGRSGVGKSSMVRAGLLPALKKQGHSAFVLRSFVDPLLQIREALTGNAPLPELIRQHLQANPERKLIFFIDQFEDFFLILPEDKRDAFIGELAQLAGDESLAARFVFILREDLLAEMSRLKTAAPQIFHYEYRLARLNHSQAILAITGPVQAVGCAIETGLPAQILDDLGNGDDVDPPQLQIVCDALFDAAGSGNRLSRDVYGKLGGSSKILQDYLERVLRRFPAGELAVVRSLLKALISPDHQRLVINLARLPQILSTAGEPEAAQVYHLTEELDKARIVRIGSQEGERWLELCHDFLIPEISSWITQDEMAITKARAVLNRAMHNYRDHRFLMDKAAIELIAPLGELLSLSPEESELLAISMIDKMQALPAWLAKRTPQLELIIIAAAQNDDCQVRIRAVESCSALRTEKIKQILQQLALFDSEPLVKKAASIALISRFGQQGKAMLTNPGPGVKVSLLQRAISLAYVREHDKGLIYLRRLPPAIAILVTLGLTWVRAYRTRHEMIRQINGAILGSSFSGIITGLLLGGALSLARHAPTFESTATILVLISLGALAGAFGGLGVASGIVFMKHVSYRHSHWWSVTGGVFGGFMMGGLINILGVDILRTLFGQHLTGITGALEGAVIGLGLALGAAMAETFYPKKDVVQILGAALGSMIGAILLTLIEGNLFSGSIEVIAQAFSDSKIHLDTLASIFGEKRFGLISRIILGAMEGFVFGGFLMTGIWLKNEEKHQAGK